MHGPTELWTTPGCQADVDVAEMDNYPYSCWRLARPREYVRLSRSDGCLLAQIGGRQNRSMGRYKAPLTQEEARKRWPLADPIQIGAFSADRQSEHDTFLSGIA